MVLQEEIKRLIGELKTHFDSNLNNKYVKNILLKLDIPLDIRHNMSTLLDYKTLYFDSKGSIDDMYSNIKAITYFIKEIKFKVFPNIYNYTGTTFFAAGSSKDPNDKILFQMAVKNYTMNIKMFGKITYNLLKSIIEYDKTNFTKDPAYVKIKDLNETIKYLEEIIKEEVKINEKEDEDENM